MNYRTFSFSLGNSTYTTVLRVEKMSIRCARVPAILYDMRSRFVSLPFYVRHNRSRRRRIFGDIKNEKTNVYDIRTLPELADITTILFDLRGRGNRICCCPVVYIGK